MTLADPRLLILGAHPDDAEFHAGGLATVYRSLGYSVKLISVTDGGAGHHQRSRATLIETRRDEAAARAVPPAALRASLLTKRVRPL